MDYLAENPISLKGVKQLGKCYFPLLQVAYLNSAHYKMGKGRNHFISNIYFDHELNLHISSWLLIYYTFSLQKQMFAQLHQQK